MKLLPFVSIAVLNISTVAALNLSPASFFFTESVSLTPQVTTRALYDDNIYNQGFDETQSLIYLIMPSLKFSRDDGINYYRGTYDLTAAYYSNSDIDNFVDHRVKLITHTEFNAKHRIDFTLNLNNLHDDRGASLTEYNAGFFTEPLKYNQFIARGTYQLGGLKSIMRISAGATYRHKTYRNFLQETKYSNYDGLSFFTDADYQIGNVTFLTFELSTKDTQYFHLEEGNNSSNNRDSRSLVGVKWSGLGKTAGSMKAGYQYKSFESDSREKFLGNTVDLSLTWQAEQYSTFTGQLNRAAEESDSVGDYVETLTSSIAWKHDWTGKLYSYLQYIYSTENYVGASRKDVSNNASLNVNYVVTRWLKMTVGYKYTAKSSNVVTIGYDKNSLNLSVLVAL